MRTTVYIGASLDGYIARKDGELNWLDPFADKEASHAYNTFISSIDAIVIGRGTFEKVLGFSTWPYEKDVFVLSTSITEVPDKVMGKASILSMPPVALLHYLSERGFSHVYVDGGKVIQHFLREDLIDDLIISKVPVLIGNGIPLFGYLDKDLSFLHIRTEVGSNGLVRSYYERKRD